MGGDRWGDVLTEKQLAVLQLMPCMSKKEIARRLGTTPGAVKGSQFCIYRKWNIRGGHGAKRLGAVVEGVRRGLIDLASIRFPDELRR